ncbi:hypothetical protein MNBD_UNCLBAC01-1605 [hydrothermal vent metagenome]|uniref:Globin-sensor domain-containing protein n=1 Tax=hydrothermal vent metagenome TaxID=652676 RepID=A0A3B1DPZ8_9ZZZZ
MKSIDENKLESDLAYRFGYVSEFIGLTEDDIKTIHASAEHLAPLVEDLVDKVYNQLQEYDCTWRHFIPRQAGYDGPLLEKSEDLTMEHPQITFRKKHLQEYLVKLVSEPYDEKMVAYLDMVGKIHTPKAGNEGINVPLVQMNALMGFVSTMLMNTISELPISEKIRQSTINAFTKLLWIQNDLIVRHYAS